MVMRLVHILVLIMISAAPLTGQQVEPEFPGTLEVVLDPGVSPPFEQEMILITVRGVYPYNIALETLVAPDFEDVGWTELGTDNWYELNNGGKRGKGFERRIALFPNRSGQITIGSFVHRLVFATVDGRRIKQDFVSPPLTIDVLPMPPTDGMWMPAGGVSITQTWDIDPEQLAPGEAAIRTVTIEALGLGPEALPPVPEMRAKGLMAFFDGEVRSRIITPNGPVSQVQWRWTVRPSSSTPAMIEPVVIPWFDTTHRTFDEVIIAPQRVAVFSADAFSRPKFLEGESLQKYAVLMGLLMGMLLGAFFVWPVVRAKQRQG